MLVTVIVMVATGILIVSVVIFQVIHWSFKRTIIEEDRLNDDFNSGFILRREIVSFSRTFKMRWKIVENEREQYERKITMVDSQEKFSSNNKFLFKTFSISHCKHHIDVDIISDAPDRKEIRDLLNN